MIGLYFSADWCTPCQGFNPLLKTLYSGKQAHCTETNRNIPPFEVVLVSRCRDARATEHYFSTMPWAAMLHAEATGARGLALRDRFAITTIPALVLLDGEGAVLCRNAHERLRDDPLGKHFPWAGTPAASRTPRVDFDIVAHSRPDAASLGTPLRRPPGEPPPFGTVRPDSGPGPEDRGSSHQHRQTSDKGRGTPLWLVRKLARRTVPGWACIQFRSLAPSRRPASVLPQHPRHPHPSERPWLQRTYQDRDLPPSPVRVPPQVLHRELCTPWRRRQQPVIIWILFPATLRRPGLTSHKVSLPR